MDKRYSKIKSFNKIAIVLLSKVSEVEHGMSNLLQIYIRNFSKFFPNDSLYLICSQKSQLIYEKFSSDNIKICDKIFFENNIFTVALHPFNEIKWPSKNCPNVLLLCDLIPLQHKDLFPNSSIYSFGEEMKKVDKIITISYYTADIIPRFLNYPKNDIKVIRCSSDIQNLKTQNDESFIKIQKKIGCEYIIYPAAFRPHKNHLRLLESFKAINLPNTKLVFTTGESHSGSRIIALNNLINDLDLGENVINLTCISRENYKNLLLNSIGLIFPSLMEGFGLPVLEALNLNKKVAISSKGSLNDFRDKNIIRFDPYSKDEICEAILELINKKSKSKEIEIVSNIYQYTEENTANDFHSFLIEAGRSKNTITKFNNFQSNNQFFSAAATFNSYKLFHYSKPLYQTAAGFMNCPYNQKSLNKIDYFLSEDFSSKKVIKRITVLLDVSRLYTQNPYSGISKYVDNILNQLSEIPEIELIPFLDKSARGVKVKSYSLIQIYRSSDRSFYVYSKELALEMAKSKIMPVFYHSTFHPLPMERNPYWSYGITIFDFFHLIDKSSYPEGNTRKYITIDIKESIIKNDFIFPISKYVEKQVVGILNFKVNSHPIYLSSTLPKLSEISKNVEDREYDLVVLYQADPRKNFKRICGIISKYLTIKTNSKIAICGRDFENKKYLFQEKYLSNIDFVSNPSDKELSVIYSKSKVMIYLSKSEGFGIPPLESMQNGCIPIISKNTAMAEIYKDWPYLIPLNSDDDEIICIVNSIIENFEKNFKKTIEFGSKFTWRDTSLCHFSSYLKSLS